MKRVQSTCNFCAIDCNLDFCVEDGRIVRTIPTKGYPVNDGFSCIKGLSLSKQQTTVKPDALPKIRQADGSMKEVSWDEGFRYAADKIRELQAKLDDKEIRIAKAGSLAEASLAVTGIFEEAQKAANIYLQNAMRMVDEKLQSQARGRETKGRTGGNE